MVCGNFIPKPFCGNLIPMLCNDVEMKFQHNDMGFSFPFFGVESAMHGNRKTISTTDFEKICLDYHSEY